MQKEQNLAAGFAGSAILLERPSLRCGNDPGTGEMNYPYLYKEIQKAGYKGYLTMEYIPLGDQVKSLIAAVDSMRKALA